MRYSGWEDWYYGDTYHGFMNGGAGDAFYQQNIKLNPGTWKHMYYSFTVKRERSSKVGIYIGLLPGNVWHSTEGATGNEVCEIKNIKMEEGSEETPWCPPLEDLPVSWINPNLVNGTSGEWSDWITPENIPGLCTGIHTFNYTFKSLSKIYPRTIEVEWDNVEIDPDKEKIFRDLHVQYDITDDTGSAKWSNIGYIETLPTKSGIRRFSRIDRILVADDIYVFTEGKSYKVNISIRTDNWKTGRVRYRSIAFKEQEDDSPIIRNPIWCRSEMDVSNPNLFWFSNSNSVYNYEAGLDINSLSEKIEIEDCPNPYIQEGYHLKRRDLSQIEVFGKGIGKVETRHTETVTFSIYYKIPKGINTKNLYLQYQVLDDSGNSLKKYFYYVNTEIKDTWVRAIITIDSQKLIQENPGGKTVNIEAFWGNSDEYYVCGIKLEKGDKATTWVPYSQTTLDLNPGILLPIEHPREEA